MQSAGDTILGLDFESRAKLAFDKWRRGGCVYLCLICQGADKTFGSSLGLEMHLVSKHRVGIRDHRARYGPARILTDDIRCKLCPSDTRIIYEQRQLMVHFKRKHKETSLLKYFLEHIYAEVSEPSNPVPDKENILRSWLGKGGGSKKASAGGKIKEKEVLPEVTPEKENEPAENFMKIVLESSAKKDAIEEGEKIEENPWSCEDEGKVLAAKVKDNLLQNENKSASDPIKVEVSPWEEELKKDNDSWVKDVELEITTTQVSNLCLYKCKLCGMESDALPAMTAHARTNHRTDHTKGVRGKTSYERIKTTWHLCWLCCRKIPCDRKRVADHVNHSHQVALRSYIAGITNDTVQNMTK